MAGRAETPELKLPDKTNNQRAKVLLREESKFEAAYRKASEDSFRCFYLGLKIKVGLVSAVFNRVAALFQRTFLEAVTPTLESLREGHTPADRRFWLERTKKSSKDADLAIIVVWLVAFAKRPFFGQVGAVDSEQAGILKDRIADLIFYNPWLNDHIEIVVNEIRSKAKIPGTTKALAHMDIIASDASGGSHGGTPDLLIINELTHIKKQEFIDTLLANATGVPHGVVIIATNAGFHGTKAETMKLNAMRSPFWRVFEYNKPSPWMTKESLEDERRRTTPSSYSRLWLGQWVSGTGDVVAEDKISKAFCLTGPTAKPETGWFYVAGLDLGVKNDHSAVFVLGVNAIAQRLKSVYWQRWKPRPDTREVDLVDVLKVSRNLCRLFHIQTFYYDPHQAALMAQLMQKEGINTKEMTFSKPGNLMAMATAYMQAMDSEVLQLYDDEEGSLRRDLGKFTIVERGYGFRLEAVSDQFGHADAGTALVICLPPAVEALGLGSYNFDGLTSVDETPLTKTELAELQESDPELREIMELEGKTSRYTEADDAGDDFGLGDFN